MTAPTIEDLRDEAAREQAAVLLYDAFRGRSEAWPTVEAARAEVEASREPGRVSRVARDGDGAVVGWVGGIPLYDGQVLELHPLVVARTARRRGVGRALVEDLVRVAAARGARTLWVGADDETGETTLSGVDLYDDLPRRLRDARGASPHPLEFYRRLGFSIVGVMPDANGPGRPDIYLARRIGPAGA